MRARALRFAPQADRDLEHIRAHLIDAAGARTAKAVLARLRQTIRAAREQPLSGTPRPEYDPNCRFLVQRPYVVYYAYDGDVMVVLRVLHAARDRERIMGQAPD